MTRPRILIQIAYFSASAVRAHTWYLAESHEVECKNRILQLYICVYFEKTV